MATVVLEEVILSRTLPLVSEQLDYRALSFCVLRFEIFQLILLCQCDLHNLVSSIDQNMTATALKSELPTEIWYHIFRLATEVESEFDPLLWSQEHTRAPLRDIFTSSIYSTYARATRSAIEDAFPTRCNISSVSRRWRTLGITILYSSVTLKSHANMIIFLDVLKRSARADAQSGGLARCVRRITFGPSRFAKFEDSERTMARILSLCKDLVILVDDGPASGPGQFPFPEFPPLTKCPNLRYIFGKRPMSPISSSERWKWLSSMQNLHAIALEVYASHFEYSTLFQASTPTIHLPHLHTLQFADGDDAVARSVSTWDLPSLRNLIFTEENSNHAMYYILKSHGHKIERLVFTGGLQEDEGEIDNDLLPPSLPQLRFLSIPFPEPHDLLTVTPLITSPNLEDFEFPIDLHSLMPDPYNHYALGEVDLASVEGLLDMLLNERKTPSLQTVRFLKVSRYRPRIINHWLEELEKRLWERGVRLQIEMVEGDLHVPY